MADHSRLYPIAYYVTAGPNLVMAAINAWAYGHGPTLGSTALVALPLGVFFGMTVAHVVLRGHQQLIATQIAFVEAQIATARVDQDLKERLRARLDAGGSVELGIAPGDQERRH